MDITFTCHNCRQQVVIDEAGAGMTVPCPKCNESLLVPLPTDSIASALPEVRNATRSVPPRSMASGEATKHVIPKNTFLLLAAVAGICVAGYVLSRRLTAPPPPQAKRQEIAPVVPSKNSAVEQPGLVQRMLSLGQIKPDDKFLNSLLILREGIADLGEMKVKGYVELIGIGGPRDGVTTEIKGWTKEGNTYKLHANLGEDVTIEFDFNGAYSLLQPVSTKRGTLSPEEFTMTLMQNVQQAAWRKAQEKLKVVQTELSHLDAKEREQLSLLDQGVENGIAFLRADIENLKQEATKLDNRKNELRSKIGLVLSDRVEMEVGYDEKLYDLKIARDNFSAFVTNAWAAGARLINDAIIDNNLQIQLLPRNGRFDSCVGENYRLTVFENFSEEEMQEQIRSRFNYADKFVAVYVAGSRTWFRYFPSQLRDETAKKAFAALYQQVDQRLRREAGNKVAKEDPTYIRYKETNDELLRQRSSALERFDYKNEGQIEGYKEQLIKFQKEMQEMRDLRLRQGILAAQISRKQTILDAQKDALPKLLQQEIKNTFADRRRSLQEELNTLRAGAR